MMPWCARLIRSYFQARAHDPMPTKLPEVIWMGMFTLCTGMTLCYLQVAGAGNPWTTHLIGQEWMEQSHMKYDSHAFPLIEGSDLVVLSHFR